MQNAYQKRDYGSIKVYAGPMFCGKTTEVLREMERGRYANLNVGLFKPVMETRYSVNKVVTHKNDSEQCHLVEGADDLLKKVVEAPSFLQMVAIDEVQFLDPRIVEVCAQFRREGRRVVAGGLDMNYLREPFGPMGDLMAIADEVEKLKAVCKCGNDALFSKRLTENQDQVQLGGAEEYQAVCGSCYDNPKEDGQK
jgi:thymidine kinase